MRNFFLTSGIFISIVFTAFFSVGAELTAQKIEKKETNTVEIKISTVDATDLAGIKVVLHYDLKKLQYKNLAKSKDTKAMMHVVNDKNPGILIIVMASATGQKTANFDLFSISFDKLAEPDKQIPLEIEVKNVEMMSASLVEIPCSTKIFRLQ